AWQVTTIDGCAQQPTELGGKRAQEELIDSGEQPGVADEELEASQRQVRTPGGSSWTMHMRFALFRWCRGSSLDMRVGLRNHRCLLWGACHTPELWRAPYLLAYFACIFSRRMCAVS